jgi:5-methylcytosine-specific restriction endonuclease McrA
MRKDIPNRRVEIEEWIRSGKSKAYICQQLECRPVTLDNWLYKLGITYQGQPRRFGHIAPNRKHVSIYLKSGISISSHRLKVLLLRDGLKEYRCESCGQTEWLGQPIPLELHHIDGNRNNNQLSNLQLLCANCHALTPNNSGRGIKRT